MRVLRAALALGALTLSVPVFAQGSRYGVDRSRVERAPETRRDARRTAPRAGERTGTHESVGRRDVRPERREEVRFDRGDHNYRYDHERGMRERVVISGWFRGYGAPRPGMRDRAYYNGRYAFHPGFHLSPVVFARLDLLPFGLALQLGPLPWYFERRMYGRTVLLIDTRSRMIVDMYDIAR